jgi:hypothetical protein
MSSILTNNGAMVALQTLTVDQQEHRDIRRT